MTYIRSPNFKLEHVTIIIVFSDSETVPELEFRNIESRLNNEDRSIYVMKIKEIYIQISGRDK